MAQTSKEETATAATAPNKYSSLHIDWMVIKQIVISFEGIATLQNIFPLDWFNWFVTIVAIFS